MFVPTKALHCWNCLEKVFDGIFVLLFLPYLLKGSYWYLVVITIKQLFLQPVYPSKCSALQSQGYAICSLRNLFHIPYRFAFTRINIFMLLLQEFHNPVPQTENYHLSTAFNGKTDLDELGELTNMNIILWTLVAYSTSHKKWEGLPNIYWIQMIQVLTFTVHYHYSGNILAIWPPN